MKEIPYIIELINFLWKYNITENQFLIGVFVCFIFLMVMFFVLGRVTKTSETEIIEIVKDNKSYDNMSYAELLKTSEWNVFRNVVLKTKGHVCENCSKTNGTLNIHHLRYYALKNGTLFKPWEYGMNDVMILCEECHKLWHTKYKAPVIKWIKR